MWSLRFDSELEPWAIVPEAHEQERREGWADAVATAVEERWNPGGAVEFSQGIDAVLRTLLERRPAGVLRDLVTWPLPMAWPARVTFLLMRSEGAVDWGDRGYRSTVYPDSPFGAGVQYTRRTPADEAGNEESVDSVIVFDRGDVALCVRVHIMPANMYLLVIGEIADAISACSLTDDEGRLFHASGAEHRVPGDDDMWPVALSETAAAHD
ncbi:hypothetical protein [Microbacterium sp. gxy059]|uniref:hypothetical protein n=1 Tax=Microbacterium sp. gxy059 TaxID=2957199 RepID=UPI003D975880